MHKAVNCGGVLIDRDKILTVAHCIISVFDFTYQNKNYTINVNPTDVSNHHVQLGFKARSNKIKYATQMVRIKNIILVFELFYIFCQDILFIAFFVFKSTKTSTKRLDKTI